MPRIALLVSFRNLTLRGILCNHMNFKSVNRIRASALIVIKQNTTECFRHQLLHSHPSDSTSHSEGNPAAVNGTSQVHTGMKTFKLSKLQQHSILVTCRRAGRQSSPPPLAPRQAQAAAGENKPGCRLPENHIVRLYSMPLFAEMPDQGKRLQRRLWAWR